MGPESSSEYFDVAGTIESVNTTRYLNIGSDSTSYKTVTFGNASTTTGWGLEGDTIITTTASTWGRREFCFSFALPWLTAAADRSSLQSSTSWLVSWTIRTGRFTSRRGATCRAGRRVATTRPCTCRACAEAEFEWLSEKLRSIGRVSYSNGRTKSWNTGLVPDLVFSPRG